LAFRGKRTAKSGGGGKQPYAAAARAPEKEGNGVPCIWNGLGRQPAELDWDVAVCQFGNSRKGRKSYKIIHASKQLPYSNQENTYRVNKIY
jgi:hypothetical protein